MGKIIKFTGKPKRARLESPAEVERQFDDWLARDSRLAVTQFILTLIGLGLLVTSILILTFSYIKYIN